MKHEGRHHSGRRNGTYRTKTVSIGPPERFSIFITRPFAPWQGGTRTVFGLGLGLGAEAEADGVCGCAASLVAESPPVEDAMGKDVRYRRIYDDVSAEDGLRILVDRLWPRGISKQDARVDEWMRDVAPSTELRRWYGHDPARYAEFRRRYLAELRDPARHAAVQRLRESAGHDRMTLLTAARDLEHSQAAVLAHWLNGPRRRSTTNSSRSR